jgi:hypothetical protein
VRAHVGNSFDLGERVVHGYADYRAF